MLKPEQLHDSRRLLVIQLGDSRPPDRVCQDLLGVEILPEVDVKNAKRIPACRIEKTTNGVLADGGALDQRSQADVIRLFGRFLPLRPRVQKVPRHESANCEAERPGALYFY